MSAAIKQARANFQGDMGYQRAMPGTGYAGDPGLFGSIFGGIKRGLSAATSFATGGGIGGAVRALTRRNPRQIGTRRGRAAAGAAAQFDPRIFPSSPFQAQTELPIRGPRTLKQFGQAIIPGGLTGSTVQVPGTAIGARVPQGYHLNKSGYWRGAGGVNPQWIPKESIFVKNRKRNPLNPRAFDRAFGRIKSAKNFSKKLGRITIREAC